MFLMSCGVLNVKVYIYVARSLLDYHGNWGSMLEVSGRQRDLDEPCECGGRDGERESEMKSQKERKWQKQMEKSKKETLKCSEIKFCCHEKFVLLVTPFTSLFVWCPLFPFPLLSSEKKTFAVLSCLAPLILFSLSSQDFQFSFPLCPCLLPSLILFSSFSLLSSFWRDVPTRELKHQNL